MNKKSALLVVVMFCYCGILYPQENAIFNAINKNSSQLEKKHSIYSNNIEKFPMPFWKGWTLGFAYGLTQFNGDIRQYDHYPAYQESVAFYELKTVFSLSLIKT